MAWGFRVRAKASFMRGIEEQLSSDDYFRRGAAL
jgi:hypothetical protein